MKITKNTTVQEALKKSKDVLEVFRKHKLYCPGCKGSAQDTIEITAHENNLDLESFLNELNNALKKTAQKHEQ
jgi:hybrid cluster-associated redox disulfide protein